MRIPRFFAISRLFSSALILAALLGAPQNEAVAQRADKTRTNIEREGLMFWGSATTLIAHSIGVGGSVSYPVFQNKDWRMLIRGNIDTTLTVQYPRFGADVLITTADGKWYIGPSLHWRFVESEMYSPKRTISSVNAFGATLGYRHLEEKNLNYFAELDLMTSHGGLFMVLPVFRAGVTYNF